MTSRNDLLENDAAALVDVGIANGRTRRRDHNTGVSVHDFDLVFDDGSIGALEVIVLVNPAELSTSNAIGKYGGSLFESGQLAHAWHVQFGPQAMIKNWGQRIEPVLVDFERRGWLSGAWTDDLWGHGKGEMRERLVALGIEHVSPFPGGQPGTVFVTAGGGGMAGGPDDAADAVAVHLAGDRCADVRRKLASSGADSRHAFVAVHFNEFGAWEPIQRGVLPTRPPADLPDEITDVWMARAGPLDHGWWFSRADGWRDVATESQSER